MYLSELTWEDVNSYLKEKDGLIIPVGICEQHSKHLPLNTDTILAEYISNYLSGKTSLLIAPTVNYGIGLPCDRFFSGSTSINFKNLKGLIYAITDWWKSQGFKKFFIITAHGDPFHLKALGEVGREGIYVLNLFDIDLEGILEMQKVARHAGEAETSVMLYLFPDKVRKDKIEDFETPFDEFRDYLYHKKVEHISDSPGCQGYPSYATLEKGKDIIKKIKDNSLSWILERLEK